MYVLPAGRVRLSGLGQDEYDYDYGSEVYYPPEPVYTPAPESAPLPKAGGGSDWTGMISTAIKTWGSVEQTQAQTEAARRLTPYTTRPLPTVPRYGSQYPYQPGYSPFPGGAGGSAFMGMSMTTWLVLAALGIGAYYMMKR
jgi:hypothetical protein